MMLQSDTVLLQEIRCSNKMCNDLLFKCCNGNIVIKTGNTFITVKPENGIIKTKCRCGKENVLVLKVPVIKKPVQKKRIVSELY